MEEFSRSLPAPGRIPAFCKGSPVQGLSVLPAAPRSAARHGDAAPGPAAASAQRTQRVRCRVPRELPQSAGPQQHSKAQAGMAAGLCCTPWCCPSLHPTCWLQGSASSNSEQHLKAGFCTSVLCHMLACWTQQKGAAVKARSRQAIALQAPTSSKQGTPHFKPTSLGVGASRQEGREGVTGETCPHSQCWKRSHLPPQSASQGAGSYLLMVLLEANQLFF